MFLRFLGLLGFCFVSVWCSTHERRNSTDLSDDVTWDPHSLSIFGQRVFILSAEIHPWRLPGNPILWTDIFQKVKANGFNTVSFYVNWATHFPTTSTNVSQGDFQPGTYRDIQVFIDSAKDAGLWMIASQDLISTGKRPVEGSLGGLVILPANLRDNNPSYQQAWTPYLTAISRIIAKNQITNGGPIILVQAENEYSASTSHNIYMQDIINLYKATGIVVPITFNDQHGGAAGNFSPDKPGTHVDIYCGDSYPAGQVQAVYYSDHVAVAPTDPLCLAEFAGGELLGWGSTPFGGTGVLVSGPYLVRTALILDDTLVLSGDLNGTTTIQAIVPSGVTKLTWNSQTLTVSKNSTSIITATAQSLTHSPGIPPLPNLSRNKWKVSGSLPEIDPDFDDSGFVTANLTSTNYTNLPPLAGDHVLYSQQYGFYGGNLIWRGHFNATGEETAIVTTVQSGFAGGYSAWINGVFLGSSQGSSTVSFTTDTWNLTSSVLRVGQDNVFVVLQDHMGIVETSTNSGKEPRGIRGYAIVGGTAKFSLWKLQGNQGGAANAPDTFRGYLNEGGLYAERIGAHLPSFPDSSWSDGTPLANSGGGIKGAGVNFFRTTFDLRVPLGIDMPVRLSITPSAITSNFRAQIYLNGWQVGKYINNIGPQTLFVLPAGILLRNSTNTLAISLWSLDGKGASLAGLSFVTDGIFESSFPFADYLAPDYADQAALRPSPTFNPPM
ncbi:glycoside hydrolase superfamily [Gymnopilus junonius]|uniref:Beta-galactosidase n=1 Tax=Gymnopilus junonius TaxID=109634 RepID=A0A9P5THL1_GYMJU|nr:glycoside hydrolase superfamily [Gymnopilus junonius]